MKLNVGCSMEKLNIEFFTGLTLAGFVFGKIQSYQIGPGH